MNEEKLELLMQLLRATARTNAVLYLQRRGLECITCQEAGTRYIEEPWCNLTESFCDKDECVLGVYSKTRIGNAPGELRMGEYRDAEQARFASKVARGDFS